VSPKSKLSSVKPGPSGLKTSKGLGKRNTVLLLEKLPVFAAMRPGTVYRAEALVVGSKVTHNQLRAAMVSRGLGKVILAVGVVNDSPQLEVVTSVPLSQENQMYTIKGQGVVLHEKGLIRTWIKATTLLITVADVCNILRSLAPEVNLGTVRQPSTAISTFLCFISRSSFEKLAQKLDVGRRIRFEFPTAGVRCHFWFTTEGVCPKCARELQPYDHMPKRCPYKNSDLIAVPDCDQHGTACGDEECHTQVEGVQSTPEVLLPSVANVMASTPMPTENLSCESKKRLKRARRKSRLAEESSRMQLRSSVTPTGEVSKK
jgi:hypothetical protein